MDKIYKAVAHIVVNNRTMLTIRFIAENLGAELSLNVDAKEVVIYAK